MKKEQIYVEITSEQERLKAIDILEKAGEKIYHKSSIFDSFCWSLNFKFVENDNEWIGNSYTDKTKTKITLSELEQLLTPTIDSLIDNFKEECYDKGYNVSVVVESEVFKNDELAKITDKKGLTFYGLYKDFEKFEQWQIEKLSKEEILKYFEI
jgi:hypothetical protein